MGDNHEKKRSRLSQVPTWAHMLWIGFSAGLVVAAITQGKHLAQIWHVVSSGLAH